MPIRRSNRNPDYDLTAEEVAGADRNTQFDAVVDDPDDSQIEVICRRPNPAATGDGDRYIDIPLARPSRAFYFGDRTVYKQECDRYTQGERDRVLCLDEFPANNATFRELCRACARGLVIPFVGAGMSVSAGLPDWKGYLLGKCDAAGLDRPTMEERLGRGEYESVMTEIVAHLTPAVFERDFERDFTPPDEIAGTVTLLPGLFDSVIITTNFDRVLEDVYGNAGLGFSEKYTGRGTNHAFFRGIPAGERLLLKLHGNIDNAQERILSREEYDAAYGNQGDVKMNFALPRVLDRLFSSYSLLFLGCSLTADRTYQTFMRVVANRKAESLPRHYAIMSCPDDDDRRRLLDQRLADANITPIWYPSGQHESVEQML